MKAMHAVRCSGSGTSPAKWKASVWGRSEASRSGSTWGMGTGPGASVRGVRRRRIASPFGPGLVSRRCRVAAACGPSRICPAWAAFSTDATAVAAGPRMSSSRVGSPTRNRSTSPEWIPTDMESATLPTAVGISRAVRSEALISTAASQDCCTWSGPRNRNSNASPPNLSNSPPRAAAVVSIPPKMRLRISTISSAPIRPRVAIRSVSAVNPEISANTRVPGTQRHLWPGASSSHDSETGGMCRRTSAIRPPAVVSFRCLRIAHRRHGVALPPLLTHLAGGCRADPG